MHWLKSMFTWDYKLFYKWLTFNTIGLFLVLYAHGNGLIGIIFENDYSNVTYIIVAVFLLTLFLSGMHIFLTNKEINAIRQGKKYGTHKEFTKNVKQSKSRRYEAWAESLKLQIFGKTILLRFLSSSLIALGLIGTVIGFIIMASGIPASGATDAAAAGQLVSALANGMGTALYTTLVGAVLGLWGHINNVFLLNGLVDLVSLIFEYEAKESDVKKVVLTENV